MLQWPVPGAAIGFVGADLAIGNGAGCGTPPVGSNAAVDIPLIALFPAFLALRASNGNGWSCSWGSGQGCERGQGRRCIRLKTHGWRSGTGTNGGAHTHILPLSAEAGAGVRTFWSSQPGGLQTVAGGRRGFLGAATSGTWRTRRASTPAGCETHCCGAGLRLGLPTTRVIAERFGSVRSHGPGNVNVVPKCGRWGASRFTGSATAAEARRQAPIAAG